MSRRHSRRQCIDQGWRLSRLNQWYGLYDYRHYCQNNEITTLLCADEAYFSAKSILILTLRTRLVSTGGGVLGGASADMFATEYGSRITRHDNLQSSTRLYSAER